MFAGGAVALAGLLPSLALVHTNATGVTEAAARARLQQAAESALGTTAAARNAIGQGLILNSNPSVGGFGGGAGGGGARALAAAAAGPGPVATASRFMVAFFVPAVAVVIVVVAIRRRRRRDQMSAGLARERAGGKSKDQLIANLSHELR